MVAAFLMFLTLIFLSKCEIPLIKDQERLANFFRNINLNLDHSYSTLGVISSSHKSRDFASSLLKDNEKFPVMLASKTTLRLNSVKINLIIVLINAIEDVQETFDQFLNNTFRNEQGFIFFVICKEIDGYQWLNSSLKLIWHSGIFNFVLLYEYKGHLEVISYNHFNKKICNYTGDYKTNLFPNKLGNQYGNELKVVMFVDIPRTTYRNGEFYGKDARILKNYARRMNATIRYKIPPNDSSPFLYTKRIIDSGKADFSFMRFFLLWEMLLSNFIYPNKMDNIMVLVPKASRYPQYMNMFLTFRPWVWTAMFISAFVTTLIFFFARHSCNFTLGLIQVISLGLVIPVPSLSKSCWPIKFLTISWLFLSFILCSTFQTSLTSVLVTPKYHKEMTTLKDLKDSKLRISTPPTFFELLPPEFQDRGDVAFKDVIVERILKGDVNTSFALPTTYNFANNVRRDGVLVYHTIPEPIIPGFAVYYFPKKSPYIKHIERFMLEDAEYGISAWNFHFSANYSNQIEKDEDDRIALNLNHLQAAFYIIIMGDFVGVFIFGLEVLSLKYVGRLRCF